MPLIPLFPSTPLIYKGFSIHKKPTFASLVQTPPSGREVTGAQQIYPLWEFELTYEVLRDQSQNTAKFAPTLGFIEFQTLSSFWLSRNGQYGSFYYQDIDDYSRLGQEIATGDGATTDFLMVRTFGLNDLALAEPVGGVDVRDGVTLNIYLDDVLLPQTTNWWIDTDLRTLRFLDPPGDGVVITADFSFFYFCRFITDEQEFEEFNTGRWLAKGIRFRSTPPDPPIESADTTYGFTAYSITDQNTDLTTPQYRKLYFEFKLWDGNVEHQPAVGICGTLPVFQTDVPVHFDVSPPAPSTFVNGLAWSFKLNGTSPSLAWGYPASGGSGPHSNPGDVIGVAIDTVNKIIWCRNCTIDDTVWFGGGPGTPDPVTGVFGWDFDSLTPLTGDIHVLIGGGWDSSGPQVLAQFDYIGTSFTSSPPAGFFAWGDIVWAWIAASPYIDDRDMGGFQVNPISGGSNQSTAWIFSLGGRPTG